MLIGVKRCIEQNDIRGLHYIFAEALEVDPTFENIRKITMSAKKSGAFWKSMRSCIHCWKIRRHGMKIIGCS